MSRGVIYFNEGTRCLIRLCVSLHSLRKVFAGPITVLVLGETPAWARSALASIGSIDVVQLSAMGEGASRLMKASLWRHSPYELSLFLDSDTVVLQDPSPLFDTIADHGFVTTQFSDWRTDGRRMRKRIGAWARILSAADLEAALRFGPAVNTGVFGWRREASILLDWEQVAGAGWRAGCTRRLVDELACQVVLHKHPHAILDESWNWSCRFGKAPVPKIVHFHGGKHTGEGRECALWKEAYWELRNSQPSWDDLGGRAGDGRLTKYLRQVERSDVTIVTVVNRQYLERLRRGIGQWQRTEGLREQRFLVLVVGDADVAFLRGYSNVEVVRWQHSEGSRADCLAAFVFGPARHVRTPYWMKLDCDATPIANQFEWPQYAGFAITAHRWGYTRVKDDPGATKHWLNTLDDWWGGEPLFPPDIPLASRFAHKRIASFCSIESTDFTRRLAAKCGDRLIVPSQDTTAWYAATRWGEAIQSVNMKRFLKP